MLWQPVQAGQPGRDVEVTLLGHAARLGVAASNGPAAQDPLISSLNWSLPYGTPPVSLTTPAQPAFAAPEMESAIGATVHLLVADSLYLEAGAYDLLGPTVQRSFGKAYAPSMDHPTAPYARLGYGWHGEHASAHLGAAFLSTQYNPQFGIHSVDGMLGRNVYTNLVIDAGVQAHPGQHHEFALYGAYIQERQRLRGLFSRGASDAPSGMLEQVHLNAAWMYDRTWRLSVGMQTTWGEMNRAMYRAGPIGGSRNGKPNSTAFIIEANWLPFGRIAPEGSLLASVKTGIQYVAWTRFNGASTNYDGFGRAAAANNSLWAFVQMSF